MTELYAILAVASGILTALLVRGFPWLREILKDRRERQKLEVAERRHAREDTEEFLRAIQGESKEARETLKAWFKDVKEQLAECRAESARMATEMRELKIAHSDCQQKQRQQQRDIDELKRQLSGLRQTLVRDYARRPDSIVPAGDAETPISDRPRKDG